MNKFRYVDKEILCKYNLSEEFLKELSLEINDIIPLRKVFVLLTNEGKKILKITDSTKDRIKFINEGLKYIRKSYDDVLTYFQGRNGKVFYEFEGNTYVLLDMIEGREATFTNPIEVEMCSKAIANMHIASKGIINSLSKDAIQGNLGEYLPGYFVRASEELNNIKSYVAKFRYKNKFDEGFINNVDKYINQIKKSEELLAMCEYNLLLQDYDKRVLCHNDLANHNFIVDGENVKIIDFDYCSIDTRAVDFANFALKAIKNSCYDMDKFKSIISSYNSVSKLNKEEIKLIYAIMSFPRDFYSISVDYYYKQKSWDYEVFENRLKDKLDKDVYRSTFLGNYIKEMEEYFY